MNEPIRTQWQIRCAFNGFCKLALKREAMRKLRDERGNIYWGIDEDIRDRLRSRLMRAVLSFKV